MALSAGELQLLMNLWIATNGEAWEPKNITSPVVGLIVSAGYWKVVDGRCFFERLPASMLAWTDAGSEAMRSRVALEALDKAARPIDGDNTGDRLERFWDCLPGVRAALAKARGEG